MSDDDSTAVPRDAALAFTAASIAGRVRRALEAADLDEFADLLSPDVHWGPPGDPTPPCRNRSQVLRWYAQGHGPRGAGRASPRSRSTATPSWSASGSRTGEERWQVMRVGPEGVTDTGGYEDQAERRGIGSLTWSRAEAPPEATTMGERSKWPVRSGRRGRNAKVRTGCDKEFS